MGSGYGACQNGSWRDEVSGGARPASAHQGLKYWSKLKAFSRHAHESIQHRAKIRGLGEVENILNSISSFDFFIDNFEPLKFEVQSSNPRPHRNHALPAEPHSIFSHCDESGPFGYKVF